MTTCNPPLVSIGMPVYNEERYLREALDSLLAQDFADFELVISDNASEDATQRICLEYASRDPRIRYHRNETNVGNTENFNRAFRLSKNSKYFMWAGGHDVWAPTYLSRCLEVLESDESVVACVPQTRYIGQDGEVLGKEFPQIDTRNYGRLLRFNLATWEVAVVNCFSVMRASTLRQTHLGQRVLGWDLLLGLEFTLLGPLAVVPELLFFQRDNRGEHKHPEKLPHWTKASGERQYPDEKYPGGRFPTARATIKTLEMVSQARVGYGLKAALIVSTIVHRIVTYPLYYCYGRLPMRMSLRRHMHNFRLWLFTRTRHCLARDSATVLYRDSRSPRDPLSSQAGSATPEGSQPETEHAQWLQPAPDGSVRNRDI